MLLGVQKYLQTHLRASGLEVTRTTSPEQIRAFLALVRPITTDKKLIRIGGDGDGGYLVPDDLDGVEACFSPGVADTATFESELASRGIKAFLADYSVDTAPVENPLFHFDKKYLGLVDDLTHMRLETWVEVAGPFQSDLILQMDIEGGEYDVIFDSSTEVLSKFRILVIEFHRLAAQMAHPLAFNWLRATFAKVLKTFAVVHIHPNNCAKPEAVAGYDIPPVMEFSFLRKDRIVRHVNTLGFPHELDRPNRRTRQDYALPQCWFAVDGKSSKMGL